MRGEWRSAKLLRDPETGDNDQDGVFCVSRVNPMFIDDNDQEINMKDVDLDKDLARCPTMRERSNSSGYGSSNHSEGIYNDEFKDSPVHSNNATLSGLPLTENTDPANLIPLYSTNSRAQSRWTETFKSDSEYYQKNSFIDPQFNDSPVDDNNVKENDNYDCNNPKPRPRLNLPQPRVLGSLENTAINLVNKNKENIFTISKDLENKEPIETVYQNAADYARVPPVANYQNYLTYDSPSKDSKRLVHNQISKANRDSTQISQRVRDLYPGKYRRESRASSLSSGSVTSSSGQGTLSTIPEGKLLTEEYHYFGDVMNRKNDVSGNGNPGLEGSKDNFEIFKDSADVQSGHHGFAIPRPVWPPMDRIVLARRKYDGWDSDSNFTRNSDPIYFESKMTRHDSNKRRNSNFEIDLNLDPRFHGHVDTSNDVIDDRSVSSKCRCDASRMLVKLSQEIESILLEAHSPRSALLTIRQELLEHIKNHDCPGDIPLDSKKDLTSDDVYGLRDVTDIPCDRMDSISDACRAEDMKADLLQQKPKAFPRSEVMVNFATVHHGTDEDAMRRLSVCLRSDRKLLTVARAFGDKDPVLKFETDVFNTNQNPFSKNSEPYNSKSDQCEYVNVNKTDAIIKSNSECVNQNSKKSCDSMSELSINYNLMERDDKEICGKETRAHREKPSIWQMYYMQNAKTQQIKDDFNSKMKKHKAKHIPYFPSGGRPEADFTLDMPRQELLSKKLRTSKKQRCMCRTFAWFLCLVVFLATVIVVSLILTRGRRVFGSMV